MLSTMNGTLKKSQNWERENKKELKWWMHSITKDVELKFRVGRN